MMVGVSGGVSIGEEGVGLYNTTKKKTTAHE